MSAWVGRVLQACKQVSLAIDSGSECVYHKALETQLRLDHMPYQSEVIIPVDYRGHNVGSVRADLVVGGVVLELKALLSNSKMDAACRQVRMYCRLLGLSTGVVVNFAQDTGEMQHFVVDVKPSAPVKLEGPPSSPLAPGAG